MCWRSANYVPRLWVPCCAKLAYRIVGIGFLQAKVELKGEMMEELHAHIHYQEKAHEKDLESESLKRAEVITANRCGLARPYIERCGAAGHPEPAWRPVDQHAAPCARSLRLAQLRIATGRERALRLKRLEELSARVNAAERVLANHVTAEMASREAHALIMAAHDLRLAVGGRRSLQAQVCVWWCISSGFHLPPRAPAAR